MLTFEDFWKTRHRFPRARTLKGLAKEFFCHGQAVSPKAARDVSPIEAPGSAAKEALEIIKEFNHIRNDLDSYLYDVAEWGLGVISEKPKPEDFGI